MTKTVSFLKADGRVKFRVEHEFEVKWYYCTTVLYCIYLIFYSTTCILKLIAKDIQTVNNSTVSQSVSQLISQTINQSINQSVNQSINQSVNQSFN